MCRSDPHLLLEQDLSALERSESVLFVLVLQVLIGRLEVSDQILKTQTDRFDGQVEGGCLALLTQSVQTPELREEAEQR